MWVVVQLGGGVLVVAVLLDVWLAILHPDAEGVVASAVRRTVWRAASRLAAGGSRHRRGPLVLAGPLLVTVTFLAWIMLLVVGVAFVVWPALDGFRSTDENVRLGFVDALYYAGCTLTVLGPGDITPRTGSMKILSVVVAAVGFAFFTALVTYLIELIAGLVVRNRFAFAVHDQTRDSDGVGVMIASLVTEGPEGAAARCHDWADMLRAVDETVRRYPLVALTYRPRRPDFDLEPALERVAGGTVAALLAAGSPRWRGVGLRADELAGALRRIQDTISGTYFRRHRAADDPQLRDAVTAALAETQERMAAELGERYRPGRAAETSAYEVLAGATVFLHALEGWAAPEVAQRLSAPRHPDSADVQD
jgi:Ion channel